MELKEFIENTIADIVDAISELKEKYNKEHSETSSDENPISPDFNISNKKYTHSIDFDIAVTTSENGTTKSGSKIGISVIGANINGENGYNNENTSRIKFSIPFYPEYIYKK